MSDKPIEVGKWAIVYKPFPCCGATVRMRNIPFVVTAILRKIDQYCPACNGLLADGYDVLGAPAAPNSRLPMECCKRIDDPPAEPDELEQITEDIEEIIKVAEKQL